MAKSRVKWHDPEVRKYRRALASGVQNFAYAVEAGAKREAPVRGGYRSFLTTRKTKAGARGDIPVGANNGSVLIGGTLRRSIHSAVFVDGMSIGADQVDENGETIPDYPHAEGIVAVIGTNCTYGAYVEIGTVKMQARPFLGPAFDAEHRNIGSLIKAGMRKAGY